MDINRIREFLVLSEQLNYSKAANILYITQPVLSRHIHDLEETFGGQLFVRDTHKVHLTEFGELCVSQLQEVVRIYDKAIINIEKNANTSSDSLTIGFLEYAVRPFLNKFAAWFDEAHPNIEINYASGDLDDLADGIMDGDIDLAFVTHVGSDSIYEKDIDSELIYEDPLIVAVTPDHPCACKESITLGELSEYPIISYSRKDTPYTADFHVKQFDDRGLQMDVVKEVKSFESGLFYAKSGIGAFLIPQHMSFLADDLITIPVSDDDCTIPLNLTWKKDNPKESLRTYVRDFKRFYANRLKI